MHRLRPHMGVGLGMGRMGSPSPKTASGVVLHAWWRIKVTATSSAYVGAAEIQMHSTIGGPDLCVGGTAIADSFYSPDGLFIANAFDDDINTDWASNGTGTAGYIGYHFASGVNINEVTWLNRNIAKAQVPTDVTIDYSDNGTVWIPKWAETGLSWGGLFTTVTMVP